MKLFDLLLLLQQQPNQPNNQPAQPQGQSQPDSFLFIIMNLLPFIVLFIVFWYFLIRPQSKQRKEREAMISSIQKDDHVLTAGGIYGIVDRIKENDVYLKIDEKNSDVKIKVARQYIVDVEKRSGKSN